jgi:hypothetical protein
MIRDRHEGEATQAESWPRAGVMVGKPKRRIMPYRPDAAAEACPLDWANAENANQTGISATAGFRARFSESCRAKDPEWSPRLRQCANAR